MNNKHDSVLETDASPLAHDLSIKINVNQLTRYSYSRYRSNWHTKQTHHVGSATTFSFPCHSIK